MGIFFPSLSFRRWLTLLGIASLGAIVAGFYGIVHDQVTFSISPEYFTRLKFVQFRWADLGLPMRAFVGEIGFLATWWVGFIAGWVLGRISAQTAEPRVMLRDSLCGFAIVFGCALVAAAIAFQYGRMKSVQDGPSAIAEFASVLGVSDVSAFVRVGYIHNAGYLGGLVGIIAASALLWRKRHHK